jgi:Transposase DDE domain
MGRSRGGLTTNVYGLVDTNVLSLELVVTPGQIGDCPVAERLLGHPHEGTIVLTDKAYDSGLVRRQIEAVGAAPNIPPMGPRRRCGRRWRIRG